MLSVSQMARYLGVSPGTVRNYSREFTDHLSPLATPRLGEPRRFAEDDLRVMATAKSLLGEGLTYEQVRGQLAQGVHLVEDLDLRLPPPEPEPTETALVPMASVRLIVQPYMQQAEQLRKERDQALGRVVELERHLGRLEGLLEGQRRSWLQRLLGRG